MTDDINTGELKMERMPDALLAGLFTRGIVVLPEDMEEANPIPVKSQPEELPTPASGKQPQAVKAEKTATARIQFLGGFDKKILVVVNDPTSLHLNQEDFDFLGKILAAVKLSIADIALVNAATQQLEYFALQEQLPAVVALYFGMEPVEIGAPIKFPQFQVQKWNHCTFLYAPPFEEMGPLAKNAVALKTELWAALKKIFA